MKKGIICVLTMLLFLCAVHALAAEDVYEHPVLELSSGDEIAVGEYLELYAYFDYSSSDYYAYYNIDTWEWKLNGVSQGSIQPNETGEYDDMLGMGDPNYDAYAYFYIAVPESGSISLRLIVVLLRSKPSS